MDHADFRIGQEFWVSDRLWRCTDVDLRVIVAIRIDEVTAVRMEWATMIKIERTMTGAEAEREGLVRRAALRRRRMRVRRVRSGGVHADEEE